jgi:uncharacterized NAD(P)/FAD-binding protein YdhS
MRKIVVIGGGASGVLVAAALARRPDASITIVDPSERLGRGVAYSTTCPAHLLNVPAGKISAFPDRPDHFVRWLEENAEGSYDGGSFVARSLFGDYLGSIADETKRAAGARLRHVRAFAVDAFLTDDGVSVTCSSGETLTGDAVVLASGNAAPARWRNVSSEVHELGRFYRSAWDPGAIVPNDPYESVLLLGTGLTAVDAVLGLRHHGHRGVTYMVSRRGLLPHEHRVFDTPPATAPDADTVVDLLDGVRTEARKARSSAGGWRSVVDGVRPRTNALWQSLALDEQRRFLRHAMPYWNVHRHRIPPESAKAIAELMVRASLKTFTGRTGAITVRDGVVQVPIVLRGSGDTVFLHVDRIINCSGPEHDFRKLSSSLVQRLLDRGTMSANPLRVGVRVAPSGALVDRDGVASDRFFAIGPARFGTLIETTAIPEIRMQAYDLAEHVTGNAIERYAEVG